jgi:hypothetical protein
MNKSVLSQIRIIDSNLILPFEWEEADSDISGLSPDDISQVRNPFPVIRVPDGNYLLLEDAPLFRFLAGSGAGHVPAQVYPEASIKVLSDKLALVGFSYEDLITLVARHPDQLAVGDGGSGGSDGFIEIGLDFNGSRQINLLLRHSSRTGCPASLDCLFRAIMSKGPYLPMVDQDDLADHVIKPVSPSAIMTLPTFSLDELKSAAASDRLFPPNIVRPVSDYRVISIDFPVSVLRSDISGEEKELFLRELILFRERTRKTTCLQGMVYILNR